MDNDELFIALKDMFEKKTDEIKNYVDEKVTKQGTYIESLERNFKAVAETHSALNEKVDNLSNKIDKMDKKVDNLDMRFDIVEKDVKSIKADISVVKEYVKGVDNKLNEHEIILKRVK